MIGDTYDSFLQYFQELRALALIVATAVVLGVVVLAVAGGIIALRLTQLVEVQRKIGQHAVWAAQQSFRPTPDNPYPPKRW